MTEAKYAVIPGDVTSRSDGEVHFVSARELMRLYGVPVTECVVVRPQRDERVPDGLIPLRPRYNGDYSLPEESGND